MQLDLRNVPTFIYTVNLPRYEAKAKQLALSLGTLGFTHVSFMYGGIGPISPWHRRHTPWSEAVATITPPFIILEDDATLTPDYQPIIDYPDDAELVYLGGTSEGLPISQDKQRGLHPSLGIQIRNPPMYYEEHDASWIRVRAMLSAHAILFVDAAANRSIVDSLHSDSVEAVDGVLSHWLYDHRGYCRKRPFWYQYQPELPIRAITHKEYYRTEPQDRVPPIVFQTGKHPLDWDVIKHTRAHCPGFGYQYFTDVDILSFFRDNPLAEFPNIARVFHSFAKGEHKADLFRYYFLYLRGGVFIDNDATLTADLKELLGDCDLMLCDAIASDAIFNGFIAAKPRHPLIYAALRDAYTVNPQSLSKEYLRLCRFLKQIAEPYRTEANTKIVRERTDNRKGQCIVNAVVDNDKVVCLHFPLPSRVPTSQLPINFTWDDYSAFDAQLFPLSVLRTHPLPNGLSLRLIGSANNGGYVVADPLTYDRIISGGVGNNWTFERDATARYAVPCFAFDSHTVPRNRVRGIQWIRREITRHAPLHHWIQPCEQLLVKMDIEGGEFAWLSGLSDDELRKMLQLVIEVHFPFTEKRWLVLERLSRVFTLVHIHGNNAQTGVVLVNGVAVPEVMELTYLNRSVCDTPPHDTPQNYPIAGLDYPCGPNKPDLHFTI